jgi:tetratricopeptide (TPR) repeat protein
VPDVGPSPERIRAALEELLGWQGISRSPQLAELLRYVVEKTLKGEGAGIKAYSIAVDVFGRPPDFDPQADPIVRVQARRLRTLLEQFYDSGIGVNEVQIHLPLGRYVPEFKVVAKPNVRLEIPTVATAGPAVAADPRRSRFLINAILGLAFTLVGVGLAVVIVRWVLPSAPPRIVVAIPEQPRVAMGAFDNLTGEPVLDDDVALVGPRLAEALGRFESLTVATDGLTVNGTVQEVNGQFVLRAMVVQPNVNGVVWTTTINAPTGLTDTMALTAAGNILAAQLGNASGPLHAPGRAWLSLQTVLPDTPTAYLCQLLFMSWRDSRRLVEAEAGARCYGEILETSPDDAIALAAAAGMLGWRTQFLATPSDNLSQLMTNETADAGRAVSLKPDSSFIYEQQAVVLARQGSVDAAIGAISKAHELNPLSMDVASVYGLLLWIDGQYAEGMRYSEESLAAIPFAPPWYHLTRAFNALREQRFFDAIDAAQALASGDEEFGPVIALAAAPRAAREDLIDRYRPMVMDNPHFQAAGILPRLSMRVRPEGILQRFREGLILAGIPVNALDLPFNPDGSERLPDTE